MGTTLTGTTPQDTYDSLIKVTDNGPLSGTAKYLSDGLGNDSSLALSTGNIGIGTTSPSYQLTLNKDDNNYLQIRSSNAGAAGIYFGRQNDSVRGGIYYDNNADALYFQTNNLTTNTVITSAGNVGIGTSAPIDTLQVNGGISVGSDSTANNRSRIYESFGLNIEGGAATDRPLVFRTNLLERMRISYAGNVSIGTTFEAGKLTVEQPSAARVATLIGNSNAQGFAQNHRVVRHYPVVSLGTKLIIPFVSQGSLNSTTIVRVFGHSARFNSTAALAFTADFEVGHLTSIQASATLSSTGNVASIASNGASAMEITFTSAYTAATGDGVFVTIEYMTNNVGFSIDVPNITMN